MKLIELLTENQENPIQIQKKTPSFGWKVEVEEQNWVQDSYRICVEKEGRTVWDSGVVKCRKMTQVLYDGEPLESDSRYEWKLEVWGGSRTESVSAQAYFETALFEKKDWKGCFLGEKKDGEYHLYRKAVTLEKKLQKAKLYVCGLGHHEFYINGSAVSDRVLEPGWSDYRKTCFYSTYDVTEQLLEGENVLMVMLGDGMFHVPGGRYVYFTRSYGKSKVCVQLNLTYEDGSRECIVTDENWKWMKSPVTFSCIYGGEDYDARLEQKGAFLPGSADQGWTAAEKADPPEGSLQSPEFPPMKVMEIYEPVSVKTLGEHRFLYDFGKNFSGWVRIALENPGCPDGTYVKILPGEILDKTGMPDQRVTGQGYAWKYTLNAEPKQEYAAHFSYTGFRYALIEIVLPEPETSGSIWPKLTKATGEMIYPDVKTGGGFTCSNELFVQIHEIILQAMKSNLKSYMTDCPHREKLPWLEQTHLIGPGMMYNFDLQNLYEKIEQDMADAQRENGLVPDICPEYVHGFEKWHAGYVDSPEWGSACIINPWYVYKHYGNPMIFTRYYETMKRYLHYLDSRTHHGVLHHGLGDWLDIGPCTPYSQNTPVPVIATCIFYYDLCIMEQVAGLLGQAEDAAWCSKRKNEVFDEYNLQFLDDQTGRYANGSQAAQAMSLVTGLVPEHIKEKVIRQLQDEVVKRNYAITAGDVGHPFFIAAMMQCGCSNLLNTMTNITETPGYGYQVVHGATTLTEEWDGPEPGRPHGSQNHFMLGGIEEWFYSGLAGIQTIRKDSAFDEIVFCPYIADDMEECSAWVAHPYGRASLHWKKTADAVEITIEVPPNASARLETETKEILMRVGSGTYTYMKKRSL